MKKINLYFICFFLPVFSHCQTAKDSSTFNFGFEKTVKNKFQYWNNIGSNDYVIAIDSSIKHGGNYAASISNSTAIVDFKALSYTLPGNFKGKKLTISGYIKTENVSEGYAGLLVRIDPNIAFNNMQEVGIKGTSDWTKYEVTVDMDFERTEAIVVGGILTGKGKMWLDDMQVTVDGKDITTIIKGAKTDKSFGDDSKIDNIVLDKSNTENLKMLGLIWGFVKYYHPKVGEGNFNFDNELFRLMPKVLASKTKIERDIVFVNWIKNLGEFEIAEETKIKEEIKTLPDLDWLEKSNLSSDLTMILNKVKNAKRDHEHYYIGLVKGVNRPEFKNEKAYTSLKYPDAGFRLLCLYRYWNMIQYYFPYKYLIKEDWKNILEKYIPTFVEAKNELEYKLATLALIAEIHDMHANIFNDNTITNYRGLRYSALGISFIQNKPVVAWYHNDSLAKETGLKIGDVITSINNKTVDDVIKNILKYTPASNYPTQLKNIAPNLLRTNDSFLVVKYLSNDIEKTSVIKTYPTATMKITSQFKRQDTCFRFIDKDIAYLYAALIKNKYLPKIMKDIENTKGLIIDLRCYPSDPIAFYLGKYLMTKKTDFVKFAIGNIKTPGLFTINPPEKILGEESTFYKGKVIILVNEISISQSEFTAMAFRVAPNATVIGSTTAGADGNVSPIELPGGISTGISGINVLYPNGKETQRIGIVPDIEVKPTIEGVKQGKDEVLLKAIELINE
jgi:C-terminal processing protease CtpA/Prc